MNAHTATATLTLDQYVAEEWISDPTERDRRLADLHYRNRTRWANVMPAYMDARDDLANFHGTPQPGPYFDAANLGKIYAVVMGGTVEWMQWGVTQAFGGESAHIVRPMLQRMWSTSRV